MALYRGNCILFAKRGPFYGKLLKKEREREEKSPRSAARKEKRWT